MKPPYAIGSVPSLSGHAVAYRWRSLPRVRRHRASKPQGSSERVLPWQITMDQMIFASLSHTHYWYEVGMLKVPCSALVYGVVVVSFTLPIGPQPYPVTYVVANSVRDLLNRKISGGHLQSVTNKSTKTKQKLNKNDKKKGTIILIFL